MLKVGYLGRVAEDGKSAIASLWSVDDAGTQALMEAFYKDLKKGDISTTEALESI